MTSAGHLAPLAHLDGAVDRGVAPAESTSRTLDAGPRGRDLDRRALGGRVGLGLEERRAGGAHGQGAVARLAEPREELGQVVRAVAAALRIQEREERLVHAPGVGVAIRRLLGHRGLEDRHELGRRVGPEELDRRVLARLHAPHRLERGRRAERVHARDALVEHGAEREEIAPRVDAVAARLLRAHVTELSLQLRARVSGRARARLAPWRCRSR